ncbi:hypothetical protein GN958_ATG11068, partial [Phytophthora infestans]
MAENPQWAGLVQNEPVESRSNTLELPWTTHTTIWPPDTILVTPSLTSIQAALTTLRRESKKADFEVEEAGGAQATILSSEAEGAMVMWVNSKCKEGCPVLSQMLRFKALGVTANEGLSPDVFKMTSEDTYAAKAKFFGDDRAAIVEHGIIHVYNTDQ